MRILHVISSLDISKGGPSMCVSELGFHLAERELSILIISTLSDNPYIKKTTRKNLKITFVKRLDWLKATKKNCITTEADIFHGHALWQIPVHKMSEAGRKNRIPYIISPHGMLEPWALNYSKLRKKLALSIFQREDLEKASCIHATAISEAENIRKLGFTNPIAVISNGLDLSQFSLPFKAPQKTKKTILFLSRVHPKKGCEVLIEAWSQIDKKLRKDWKVEIAGTGKDKYIRSLENLIFTKELSDEIKLIGPQFNEKRLSAYHGSDIFVLPTYSENFGLVVAEAMACGLPVITTKGTPWEELNTYNAGWWIELGVEPLTQALSNAISLTDTERKAMGNKGRKLVEEKYSIESVTDKMIQLYKWILNTAERPDFVDVLNK